MGDAAILPRGLQVAGGQLVLCPAHSPCDAPIGRDTARVLQAPEDVGGRRRDASWGVAERGTALGGPGRARGGEDGSEIVPALQGAT